LESGTQVTPRVNQASTVGHVEFDLFGHIFNGDVPFQFEFLIVHFGHGGRYKFDGREFSDVEEIS